MDGGISHFMVALALGIGLAATAGTKGVLSTLRLSVSAHFGWLPFHLNDGYSWLAGVIDRSFHCCVNVPIRQEKDLL